PRRRGSVGGLLLARGQRARRRGDDRPTLPIVVRQPRPELVQWYGLFGAAFAWGAQLIVGWGVAYADCTAASRRWGLAVVTWEVVLMVVGLTFAVLAEIAAVS